MPEGDTIFKAARVLNRALAGRRIVMFEPRTAAAIRSLAPGTAITRVDAAGKNLLMHFDDGFVLRSHMRMSGEWHIYRPGERWRAPAHKVRAVIATDEWVAIAVDVPVIEWIRARDLPRHAPVAGLGPDVLREPFDENEVLRRVRLQPGTPIAEILLDQTVLAGIGNVYKSEALFVARQSPFTPAGALSDERLLEIIGAAKRQMRANVGARSSGRMTTGALNTKEKLFVYRRAGRPCRRCGTPIETRRTGPNARSTYWCPVCQPTIPA